MRIPSNYTTPPPPPVKTRQPAYPNAGTSGTLKSTIGLINGVVAGVIQGVINNTKPVYSGTAIPANANQPGYVPITPNQPTTILPGKASPTATGYSKSNVPGYVPKQYVPWVQTAAKATGLPASVVAAQINTESGFDPTAVSGAGAQGIAQFEPGTFKEYGSGSPFNATDSLHAYNNLMNALLKQYHGNVRDALAAYNAGSQNIQAGYGYADSILSAAKVKGSPTVTGGSSTTQPIARPSGNPATGSGGSGSGSGGSSGSGSSGSGRGGVSSLFQAYENELNTPRTAPTFSGSGWSSPFQWWWQSFTSNYNADVGAGGGTSSGQ